MWQRLELWINSYEEMLAMHCVESCTTFVKKPNYFTANTERNCPWLPKWNFPFYQSRYFLIENLHYAYDMEYSIWKYLHNLHSILNAYSHDHLLVEGDNDHKKCHLYVRSHSPVEKNISFNFLTLLEEIWIKQYLVSCFTRLCWALLTYSRVICTTWYF
jgi:hypothetical protein